MKTSRHQCGRNVGITDLPLGGIVLASCLPCCCAPRTAACFFFFYLAQLVAFEKKNIYIERCVVPSCLGYRWKVIPKACASERVSKYFDPKQHNSNWGVVWGHPTLCMRAASRWGREGGVSPSALRSRHIRAPPFEHLSHSLPSAPALQRKLELLLSSFVVISIFRWRPPHPVRSLP